MPTTSSTPISMAIRATFFRARTFTSTPLQRLLLREVHKLCGGSVELTISVVEHHVAIWTSTRSEYRPGRRGSRREILAVRLFDCGRKEKLGAQSLRPGPDVLPKKTRATGDQAFVYASNEFESCPSYLSPRSQVHNIGYWTLYRTGSGFSFL